MMTGTEMFVMFALLCFAALSLAWSAAPATAADEPDAGPHVDASLFPRAYGVLANEHLMYPVDMSDWPVKIGPERQLFVDDYLIASRSNLTRQVHSAKPYAGNPILRLRKKPWENSFGDSAFILRDAKTGHFRMWYNMRSYYMGEDGVRYRAPTCYATSTDGIRWDKPNLGIWAYKGDKNNNITLLQGAISGLVFEPDEPDPAKRYKALVWHDPRGQKKYAPREGFYLYYSPDGLHWTRAFRRCTVPNGKAVNFPLEPVRGLGDTTNFRWDWKLKKYVANCKIPFDAPDARARALLRGPTLRTLGHSESDDLIHWTRPRMTIHRDGLDLEEDQCGELTSVPYESMWIGLLGVYRWANEHRIKQKHTQLVASRDGRHWTRVGKREAFHPLGAADAWDPDFTFPARPGPIRIGNELWCYFWGERRPERFEALGWPNPRHDMHIGLAKLRIDGFVSLNGGAKAGTVVTRPLTFEGKTLRINADITPGGHIRVAVRDMAGKTVEPYALAGCQPVTGDVFDAKVSWTGRRMIRHTAGQSLRLVFELEKAKLYSFWIE